MLIVSGKGGTGKSTVAAALATTAAAGGLRTLLVEVEGRGEITRTLGVPDPGFNEVAAPQGFSVLSISPRAAAFLVLGAANWTYYWYDPDGDLSIEDLAAGAAAVFTGAPVKT